MTHPHAFQGIQLPLLVSIDRWAFNLKSQFRQGMLATAISVASLALAVLLLFFWLFEFDRQSHMREAVLAAKRVATQQKDELKSAPPTQQAKGAHSIALISVLYGKAGEQKISLDDVSVSTESLPKEGLSKERLQFSVTGSYVRQRNFLAALLTTLNDSALDTYSCTRREAVSDNLRCDAVISKLFSTPVHANQ